MSGSKSGTSTTQTTADHKVIAEDGGIGVSAGGDVSVHMVADEAWEMGQQALAEMAGLATNAIVSSENTADTVADTFGYALKDQGEIFADAMSEQGDTLADAMASQGDFMSDALDRTATGLNRAYEGNADYMADALERASTGFSDALHLTERGLSSAMERESDFMRDVLQIQAETMSEQGRVMSGVIDTQLQYSQSEEGQISSQLVKIGIPAAALAFVVASLGK